jgi:hypothetical protein
MLTGGTGLTYSTTPIQGMEKWRRVHPLYKPTFNKILDELGIIDKDAPDKIKGFIDNDESPYTLYPMLDILSKYTEKPGYEGKAAQVISNGLTTGDINGLGSMLFMINPSTPPYDNVDGDIGDFFYEKNYTLLPDDHLKMSTEDVGKNVMNKMHTIFAVNENDINKHTTIAAWNNPSSMSSGTYGLIFVKTMKLAGRKVFDSTFYYNEKTGNAGGADISVAPIGNEFYVFHSYLNRVVKIPGDFSGFDDFVKNYDIFGTRHPQGVVQISEPFRDGGLTPATYSTKGILNSLPSPAGYPTS